MTEKIQTVSDNVHAVMHELLVPLVSAVGNHSLLRGKTPQVIEEPFLLFGQVSDKLQQEVKLIYREPSARIDLQSADTASKQIRLLATEWEKDVEKLSRFVFQINAANVELEDENLNKMLNEVLSKCVEKFHGLISCLKATQSRHLMLDDGFMYIFGVKK
jgi:hypothetical protein